MRNTQPDHLQTETGVIKELRGFRRALTVSEVAELLATSDKTIYRLAADSRLPHFRVSSSLRFDPSALIQWLKGQGVK